MFGNSARKFHLLSIKFSTKTQIFPYNHPCTKFEFMVSIMVASIFLLFFAFGIALACLMYGVGGILPVLVAISALIIVVRLLSQMLKRRAPEPFTG